MDRPRQCHLVNDRPVVIVATASGGADCLVLDWASGSFVVDRSYLSRTLPGDHRDVDVVSPERMDDVVARLRAEIVLRMATALASAPAGAAVGDVLGLDPDVVPFDGATVGSHSADGLVVTWPRLVRRAELDAVLGPGTEAREPDGSIRVVYRTEGAATAVLVTVDLPSDGDAAVTRITIGRAPVPG